MDYLLCRICLASDVKMYSVENDPLKCSIKAMGLNDDHLEWKLPEEVCFECAAILLKFNQLQAKSIKSKSVLIVILEFYKQITRKSMSNVDRTELELKSKLSIHHVGPESIVEIEHCEDDDLVKSQTLDDDNEEAHVKSEIDDDIVGDDEIPIHYDSDNAKSPKIVEENGHPLKVFVDIPITIKTKENKAKAKQLRSQTRKIMIKKAEARRQRNAAFQEQMGKCFTVIDLSLEEQIREMEQRKCSQYYTAAPYKCDKCYKHFAYQDTYIKHMAEHDPSSGDEECPVCKKRYKSALLLNTHVIVNHERQYRCRHCVFVCKQRQTRSHMATHLGIKVPYQCHHCDFVTDAEHKYMRHRRLAHAKQLSCSFCGRSFISERGLRIHLRKGHQELPKDATTAEHPCEECDITFATEKALKVHLRTSRKHNEKRLSEGIVCVRCGEHFEAKTELSAHKLEKHKSRVFPRKCHHCDVIIRSSKEHWAHIRSTHPRQRVVYRSQLQQSLCEVCGRSFKSVADLRMHSYRHKGGPTLSCPERGCSARMYDVYQLRIHMNNVHCDARRYQCDVCALTFKLKSNLARHMVVHTGARPYACDLCDKAFTQSGSRELHVRTVHYNQPHPPRNRRKHNTRNSSS